MGKLLDWMKSKLEPKPMVFRNWRLTYYYVADQNDYSGPDVVPVYSKTGELLCKVSAAFFSNMALEGTGKLKDGRLLNVSGVSVPVSKDDYQPVLDYHKKYLSKRSYNYSGLIVSDDKVSKASSFHFIEKEKIGLGYGTLRGIPLKPFKTLAADIGLTLKSDKLYKGKGGVVPAGTKVYIKEFDGLMCPDGAGGTYKHDGWCVVNDTGGGIFGAHFDVFVGTRALSKLVKIPTNAKISFDGIEKLPENYSYGLKDE